VKTQNLRMESEIFQQRPLFGIVIFATILFIENILGLSGIMSETRAEIKVEKEWQGNHCGYTEPERLVIKKEDLWRGVWGKMHRFLVPRPELPVINFEKEMVIAVFMGERKTGGYEIEIIRITEGEKKLIVEVEEKEPPSDSVQTMALTQPYHLIVIPKSSLPVRFQ